MTFNDASCLSDQAARFFARASGLSMRCISNVIGTSLSCGNTALHLLPKKPVVSLSNKLRAALPRDQFDRLAPSLATVELSQGLVLLEVGDEVDQIYFPHDGMLTLLAVMRDGRAIETATVGREGVVGAMAGLGVNRRGVPTPIGALSY